MSDAVNRPGAGDPRSAPLGILAFQLVHLLVGAAQMGNHVTSSTVIYPALAGLPAEAHLPAFQALIDAFAGVMPLVMTGTLVLGLPVLAWSFRRAQLLFWCTASAVALYGGVLAITLLGNVPINDVIHELTPNRAGEFEALRANWTTLHHSRSALSFVAFLLLAIGAVYASPGSDRGHRR